MLLMTVKQHNYMRFLAHRLGYRTWAHAAAPIVNRSITNINKKGLSVAEASCVIDALLAEMAEERAERGS